MVDQIPSAILTILITTAVAAVLSGVVLFFSRKAGLGQVQVAVQTETSALISAQKERITLLEKRIEELTERVVELERERKQDKREVARLRKFITDNAIKVQEE